MNTVLVVLMRWPQPGVGKTRLAAEIGLAEAHRLHCAFVADTLAWRAPRRRVLAVAGELAEAQRQAPSACVVAQAQGHLGCRIASALDAALGHGVERAVLVGTDSPSLPHRLLMRCADLATAGGAAMVPAGDGGFVALAVHRDAVIAGGGLAWLRDDGIRWSTEHAAADTVAAARGRRVRLALTAPWYDVDRAADLPRLHADLRAAPRRAPRTLRLLDAMGARATRLAS